MHDDRYTHLIVDSFGNPYELRDIEVVETAMHGLCLRACYREPGGLDHGFGDFRIDTAQSIEPIVRLAVAA